MTETKRHSDELMERRKADHDPYDPNREKTYGEHEFLKYGMWDTFATLGTYGSMYPCLSRQFVLLRKTLKEMEEAIVDDLTMSNAKKVLLLSFISDMKRRIGT